MSKKHFLVEVTLTDEAVEAGMDNPYFIEGDILSALRSQDEDYAKYGGTKVFETTRVLTEEDPL